MILFYIWLFGFEVFFLGGMAALWQTDDQDFTIRESLKYIGIIFGCSFAWPILILLGISGK
jgi:hypothetical protein